jgi:LysM repeat protein
MEPRASQTRPNAGNAARVLAVLALIVAAIVVAAVVAASLTGSGDDLTGSRDRGADDQPTRKYYVVQPGDTFAGIARREGISVSRLEALNPNLDTQLLPEKGCVDLVPKGCKELAKGG